MNPVRHRGSKGSWRRPKKPSRVVPPVEAGSLDEEQAAECPQEHAQPVEDPLLDLQDNMQLDPLRIMAILLWENDYNGPMTVERDALAAMGLIDSVNQLKQAAPVSSYRQRRCGSISKRESEDAARAHEMAALVMRQGNQKEHLFSICARSISKFIRRSSNKDWAEATKRRECVSPPAATSLQHVRSMC